MRLTVVQTADGRPCIVSDAQHRMLRFVSAHPGAMYDEVAEHIGFDRPSVNTYASRLEKAGLLNRELRRIDRRNRVTLTVPDGACLDFDVARV